MTQRPPTPEASRCRVRISAQLSYIGLGKETTEGTAVAPTLYLPVTAPKPEDVVDYQMDEALDNNPSRVRGVYQGVKDSIFDYDVLMYPEVIGMHLVSAGWLDTISGAGPYLHTFKIPAAGTQPTPVTITDYDIFELRQYPGSKIDQLDITLDAKAITKMVAKWKGWPSVASGTATFAAPASLALQGWQATTTIGAVLAPRLVSAGITIKRSVEPIHTINATQNPNTVFATDAEAQIKVKALFNDDTELNHMLNNDQVAYVQTWTSGAIVLTMTATKAAWKKATVDRSGKYLMLDADIECVGNATDGGPLAFTLSNSVTPGY